MCVCGDKKYIYNQNNVNVEIRKELKKVDDLRLFFFFIPNLIYIH